MGMNAYLDKTPAEQRTLVDIENVFDGHCKLSNGCGNGQLVIFRPIKHTKKNELANYIVCRYG